MRIPSVRRRVSRRHFLVHSTRLYAALALGALPAQWRADFKVLPRVTVAGEPIGIRRSYVVEDGDPRLQEV